MTVDHIEIFSHNDLEKNHYDQISFNLNLNDLDIPFPNYQLISKGWAINVRSVYEKEMIWNIRNSSKLLYVKYDVWTNQSNYNSIIDEFKSQWGTPPITRDYIIAVLTKILRSFKIDDINK